MCGYFGIVTYRTKAAEKALQAYLKSLRAGQVMTELKKRGPDEYKESCSRHHFFAHSRLAIRGDSKDAAQPFETENGRYRCLFNGEIYAIDGFDSSFMAARGDTQSLRRYLQDIEINEMLKSLNGMFSLAIQDLKTNQLSLALDYFGQKPLFFSEQPYGVVFGSTAKLVAYGIGCQDISSTALTEYLKYGFVPTEHAIFDGIKKVQPGHIVKFDMMGQCPTVTEAIQRENVHLNSLIPVQLATEEGLADVLEASVERHLISDHPVGICLSGGIDSSLVARYFNRDQVKNLIAFSVDDHSDNSEISMARKFSDHNNLKFVTCDLTINTINELFEDVTHCLDEPHSDTAILSSAALFERARKDVKVVLTGDGGDELFQGYNRHKLYNFLSKFKVFGQGLSLVFKTLAPLAAWMPYLSSQQRCILRNAMHNLHAIDAFTKSMLLIDEFGRDSLLGEVADQSWPHEHDQAFYLPGNNLARMDRVSLYYEIEARAPLLDLNLLRYSRGLDFNDPAYQAKGLPKALHRKVYTGIGKTDAKRGFNTSVLSFVNTDAAKCWGRQGAEFAGDHTGARFVFDHSSARRKYNLISLGRWADLL